MIVADVRLFPGHIACDPRSLSEIVVPVRDQERGGRSPCWTWTVTSRSSSTMPTAEGLQEIVALLNWKR